MRRCPECNSQLKNKDNFCPRCGYRVEIEESTTNDNNRKYRVTITILLIILAASLCLSTFVLFKYTDVSSLLKKEQAVHNVPLSDDPEAISKLSQSVVMLSCYDRHGEVCKTGSGFAYFTESVIVTNYHVIDDGVYRIKASTESGHVFDVTHIIAYDKEKDIAILSTTNHGLELLLPGDVSALQKGEKVVAIGSPLGLLNTVSTGVFSGYVDESEMKVLQFSAAISNGSSGGALFNDAGEVLGITFASYENGQNLNLAIPIDEVQKKWDEANKEEIIKVSSFYEMSILESSIEELANCLSNKDYYDKKDFYNQYGDRFYIKYNKGSNVRPPSIAIGLSINKVNNIYGYNSIINTLKTPDRDVYLIISQDKLGLCDLYIMGEDISGEIFRDIKTKDIISGKFKSGDMPEYIVPTIQVILDEFSIWLETNQVKCTIENFGF